MPPERENLGIYVLDVGQGDCTFIVPPDGQGDPILFDCADAYVAERFVANHGISALRAVVCWVRSTTRARADRHGSLSLPATTLASSPSIQ